jgi:hypothetical protein
MEIVKQASRISYGAVIVKRGHRTVDGSSLLGMLSLDTAGGIKVSYPDDAHDFEDFLLKFA